MRHLTLEDVARLVDEAPEPWEALHLRDCLVCRRELAEMRAQTEALAGLPAPEPPPRAWAELEARLTEEGLVRRRAPALRGYPALRVAASLALLVAGGAAGVTAWRAGSGGPATVEPLPSAPVAVRPAAEPRTEDGAAAVREAPAPPEARPAARTVAADARTVAAPERSTPRPEPARPNPAAGAELREAERDYLLALAEYAEVAAAEDADPVTRLATLEGMVRATRTALERAPEDPVVNGYHLAAMGQRDAVLRQIAMNSEQTWY
jgi:hypothetical protein